MKRFLVVAVVGLLALPALAYTYRQFAQTQNLTGVAPTTDATDGMSLVGVEGYRVTVSAPSGQTITGGTLRCYVYSGPLARWARCAAAMDLTPTTGVRDYVSPDVIVGVGAGRVKYIPNAITLSGAGTTVETYVEGRVQQ